MHTSWRSNFFSEFLERKESKKSNVLWSKSFQRNAIKTRETMSDEGPCKRVDLTSSSSIERENRDAKESIGGRCDDHAINRTINDPFFETRKKNYSSPIRSGLYGSGMKLQVA